VTTPVRTAATVVFDRPFRLPTLDEMLPEGPYVVETEVGMPPDADPERWRASVLIHLHRANAAPGLARTLTVPLTDLDLALAEDRETGPSLAERLLDEMLADPMVRLVMASDNVTETEIRQLWGQRRVSGD
jgi:hypothetical protein